MIFVYEPSILGAIIMACVAAAFLIRYILWPLMCFFVEAVINISCKGMECITSLCERNPKFGGIHFTSIITFPLACFIFVHAYLRQLIGLGNARAYLEMKYCK